MSEHADHLPAVSQLRSHVESLLLVCDDAVSPEELATACNASSAAEEQALKDIAQEFDDRGSGFELRQREGLWRLYTRQENAAVVEAKILEGSQQRLSRAALETLAVVAYRQPVTRSQVAAVRGVNCDGVMRTLALRGLIRQVEIGPEESEEGEQAATASGGAHLYETTELLLEELGIESLDQLPDLAPLLPDVESIEADY